MTYEEAIKWQEAFKKTYNGYPPESEEACNMAIDLFKKQIPMKPGYISTRWKGKTIIRYHCPICSCTVQGNRLCPECGQKLDWSDDK